MEMVGAIIDDNYDAERRQKSTQQNSQSSSSFERDQHTQDDVEVSTKAQSMRINSSMWTRFALVIFFNSQFFILTL